MVGEHVEDACFSPCYETIVSNASVVVSRDESNIKDVMLRYVESAGPVTDPETTAQETRHDLRPEAMTRRPPEALAPGSAPMDALTVAGGWEIDGLPALVRRAGPKAAERVVEFFTAQIRNANTHAAYGTQARTHFADRRGHLPRRAAGHRQRAHGQTTSGSHPHLFDWLVVGQVVPTNPAASVRGPTHVVRKIRPERPPRRGSGTMRHFQSRDPKRDFLEGSLWSRRFSNVGHTHLRNAAKTGASCGLLLELQRVERWKS